jgi:hypothetical protein
MNHQHSNHFVSNGDGIRSIQKSVALQANRLLQQKYKTANNVNSKLFSQVEESIIKRPKKKKKLIDGEDGEEEEETNNNETDPNIAIFAQQILLQTKMVLTGSDKERLFVKFDCKSRFFQDANADGIRLRNMAVRTNKSFVIL